MNREIAIALARIAGYHADSRAFTRLIIEARISREEMNRAWRLGVRAKDAGVRCDCRECAKLGVLSVRSWRHG
jgi:hypothetical protein